MVKNIPDISKQQAEVLHGISNYLSVTEIARHRKTSRTAVYKILTKLIKKGYVEKSLGIGGYAYGLSDLGKKGLHSFMGFTNKLRQHNLGIKIEVLESRRNWDQKRNVIMTMPYFNKRVQLKNNTYDLLSFGRIKLKTTSKSIIFQLPTLFSHTVEEAILQAMDILFEAITKVENRFKIKLVKNNKMNMTIISQEYARLDDALAKLYRKEGNKLYITGDDGKVWLIADYSFTTDELETIHTTRAGDDMSIVHPFLNDLRANPMKLSELKDVIQAQALVMGGIQQNQLNFHKDMNFLSTNLKLHYKVLNGIEGNLGKVGEEVQKLTKLIKRLNNEKEN
jgi:predicted transcriptional regulator